MENIPWHLDEDLNSQPMTEKAPAVKTMKSCSWKRELMRWIADWIISTQWLLPSPNA
jgi:hypothetical protein